MDATPMRSREPHAFGEPSWMAGTLMNAWNPLLNWDTPCHAGYPMSGHPMSGQTWKATERAIAGDLQRLIESGASGKG